METYAPHSQLHSHSQCQSQFQHRVPVQLAVGLQVQSSLGLSLMPCWMTFYLIAVNFVPSALFKCKFYFFQLPTPAPPGVSPSLFCGIAQIQLKPQNFWLFVPLHRCWRKASEEEERGGTEHNKKLSCKMWKTCWKTWGPNPNPPLSHCKPNNNFNFKCWHWILLWHFNVLTPLECVCV